MEEKAIYNLSLESNLIECEEIDNKLDEELDQAFENSFKEFSMWKYQTWIWEKCKKKRNDRIFKFNFLSYYGYLFKTINERKFIKAFQDLDKLKL